MHNQFFSFTCASGLVSVIFHLSCPHTEERLFSEEEEARASRLKGFQGTWRN